MQGVFYRANTKVIADKYYIKGFVQNEPDGSVYIEAEGGADALEKFIQWCKKGPEKAKVEDVIVKEDRIKNFSCFEVRR